MPRPPLLAMEGHLSPTTPTAPFGLGLLDLELHALARACDSLGLIRSILEPTLLDKLLPVLVKCANRSARVGYPVPAELTVKARRIVLAAGNRGVRETTAAGADEDRHPSAAVPKAARPWQLAQVHRLVGRDRHE